MLTAPDTNLRPNPMRTAVSAFILFLIFLMGMLVLLVPDERDDKMYLGNDAPSSISTTSTTSNYDNLNNGDTAFMCICCALVLLMTPGLAFFYGGMVRKNNLVSTLLQCFVIMGLIMMLWIIIGYSLAFGEDEGRVIGNPKTYFFFRDVGSDTDGGIPHTIYALFQGTFAIITPALITGAVAERVNFIALMFFVALWHIIVYCPLAHMEWHSEGLFHHYGHKDFAGGTVVHMSSGYSALVLALLIGKRKGEKETLHQPVHTPYVLLGTALLWFGWFGFNGGSEVAADALAAQALITTNVAAGTSMFTWVVWDYILGRKISVIGTCSGLVVGLVVITPACAYVTVGASIVMGMIGAIISNVAMYIMKEILFVDDTLDVFACHVKKTF